jgi:hypothetical protein
VSDFSTQARAVNDCAGFILPASSGEFVGNWRVQRYD